MTWGTVGTRTPASPYYPFLKSWYGAWKMNSAGPDQTYGPYYDTTVYPGTEYPQLPIPYDSTNGTMSGGDVMRSQKDSSVDK